MVFLHEGTRGDVFAKPVVAEGFHKEATFVAVDLGLFGVAFFAVAAVYKHFHAVDKGLFAFGRAHGADEGDIGSGELDSEQEDEEGVELGHDFMPR